MRFLTDQDVYALTVALLRDRGHDVVTVAEKGLSRAADSTLLTSAENDQRILVTRDRDFGSLLFVEALPGGVIYLRIAPASVHAVHDELVRVIDLYEEEELRHALTVVEPGRHRLRRKHSGV